jgi:hypothetical protein
LDGAGRGGRLKYGRSVDPPFVGSGLIGDGELNEINETAGFDGVGVITAVYVMDPMTVVEVMGIGAAVKVMEPITVVPLAASGTLPDTDLEESRCEVY